MNESLFHLIFSEGHLPQKKLGMAAIRLQPHNILQHLPAGRKLAQFEPAASHIEEKINVGRLLALEFLEIRQGFPRPTGLQVMQGQVKRSLTLD